jgi:hypothetical protein
MLPLMRLKRVRETRCRPTEIYTRKMHPPNLRLKRQNEVAASYSSVASERVAGCAVNRREQLLGIDLRSLAAFRVALGALLLSDVIYRGLDLAAHYTDAGVLPRSLYLQIFSAAQGAWSLHLLSGGTAFQVSLFALAALAAGALVIGYRPRAAALLSWVLLVSVQNRQPLIGHGGDMVLRLLLFWSIFLPLGGSKSPHAASNGSVSPQITLSPASAALLLQVALVYVFAVVFKLQDPAWVHLDAVEDSLRVEGVATTLGSALLAWPALLRLLTALTLVIEGVAPWLAFLPWKTERFRTALVFGMAAFHTLGIGATMNLGLFEYVMLVAWLPFLPTGFWDRLVARGKYPAVLVTTAPAAGIVLNLIVVAAFALVVIDNVVSLDRARYRSSIGSYLRAPTQALALAQNWRLWSTPLHNRYYVFPACLEDGTQVDLHTGSALDWDQPRRRSRNNHWWKYQLHALGDPRGARLLPTYATYLIREWEREHPERAVASLRLVWVDAAQPSRYPSELPRRVLWEVDVDPSHRCNAEAFDGSRDPTSVSARRRSAG